MSINIDKIDQNYLNTIIKSIPEIIIILDKNANYLDIITSESDDLIDDKKSLIGKNVRDILPDKAAYKFIKYCKKTFENDKFKSFNYSLKIDKDKKYFSANLSPIKFDSFDDEKAVAATIRNISDLKKVNKKFKTQKAYFEQLFNNSTEAIALLDNKYHVIKINKKFETLFGFKQSEIINKNIDNFILPEEFLERGKKYTKKVKNGEKIQSEGIRKTKNGKRINVFLQGFPIKLANGQIGIYALYNDITERKKKQEELNFQYRFQKTLAETSSSLLDVNSYNIDKKINKALEKIGKFFNVDRSYIFQYSEQTAAFSNTYEWSKTEMKSQKDKLQNIEADNFQWGIKKLYDNEIINIKDVQNMDSKAEAEQILFKNLNLCSVVLIPIFIENRFFGFLSFGSEINKKEFSSEEIQLLSIFTDVITSAFSKHIDYKKIEKLTYKDSLTGLYNRRYFEEELKRLDTKRQQPISIITADINGLKIINDSLGHKKGDELLKKSAEILKEATRDEDILARQGGDEFVILLPQTEKKEAEKIIKRIKNENKLTKEDKLTVSIALGNATKNNINQDIYEILKKADNNMYQNKLSESSSTKSKIVQSLVNTLEVKSNETKEHTHKMTELAINFGKELMLSNSELNRLSLLSTLHDIGKITISENILKKPGKLTDAEWEAIKEHSERGYKIANSSEEFALIAEEIFTHHERWDGNGYPRELEKKEIPYLARIISIIDSYEVMISGRPYKKAMTKEKAIEEIESCAGGQFDPELAAEFIEMIKNYKN